MLLSLLTGMILYLRLRCQILKYQPASRWCYHLIGSMVPIATHSIHILCWASWRHNVPVTNVTLRGTSPWPITSLGRFNHIHLRGAHIHAIRAACYFIRPELREMKNIYKQELKNSQLLGFMCCECTSVSWNLTLKSFSNLIWKPPAQWGSNNYHEQYNLKMKQYAMR